MNAEEAQKHIKAGESHTVEFKKSLSLLDEIGEAISEFSNAGGGIILVGIGDDKEVIGVQTGKKTLEDLANYIKQHTDNQVFPKISVTDVEGKNIVVIEVKESDEKPVFFKKRAYTRVGKSKHQLSASEIRKLAKESGKKVYWDEQICKDASQKDIDEDKVKWFLRRAKYERNFDIDENTPITESLERLELLKDGKLTNAAVLLFGKIPQRFFLQSKIRCAKYKGVTPITFIDMKIIEGNLIDQIDAAEKFALSHIKKAAKIVMLERVEAWEYPPDALREAIVNAVCHRDYETTSDVTVGIFDDRIEITDPGNLPVPLTPQDLKRTHKSVPRNPLIANALFLIRNIEQWGKGTNKIVEWCVKHGLKEPDFAEIAGGFMVTFYAPKDILSLIPEKGKVDLDALGLNKRQIEALRLMVNEGEAFTNQKYREKFGISNKTAADDLKGLAKAGQISSEGKGRSTRYFFKTTRL